MADGEGDHHHQTPAYHSSGPQGALPQRGASPYDHFSEKTERKHGYGHGPTQYYQQGAPQPMAQATPAWQGQTLDPKKYPALFPPGGAPVQNTSPRMPVTDERVLYYGQIKSSMPLQAMVLGIIGLLLSFGFLVNILGLMNRAYWEYGVDQEVCCLSTIGFCVGSLAICILGLVFSSISVANIAKGKYQKDIKATAGLIVSIIGCLLYIITCFVFIIFIPW